MKKRKNTDQRSLVELDEFNSQYIINRINHFLFSTVILLHICNGGYILSFWLLSVTMFVPTGHLVESSPSESPQLNRRFAFSEIQLATRNFDEMLVIGSGGFGKVYKGTIPNGPNPLTVAIKRLGSTSNQGASEFWAEVNMLSNLRHCHLVSLIGYCNDGNEMILVYEYMSRGTLEDHLHKRQTPLSWVERLRTCIGAARGLDYLHTGTGIKHGVVHRDVKSSNILLHDTWEAKISDFGLSKICPKNQHATYVHTFVKGTFGYLDPDYFYTGKLTRKSDVYAFGVVLFEVLCGKRAVHRNIDEEEQGLAIWARDSIKEGRLKQIVDTRIRSEISLKCLKEFAQIAKHCLHKQPKQRPTMAEVVVGLESMVALQEKANNALQPVSMNFFSRKAPIGSVNQTLHRFDYDTINVATENFCEANRYPQLRTYDFLYKGKLQNGQAITVARDYFCTGYEKCYMSEASILVNLEHKNLAKLLGYCIKGNIFFLVYALALHASFDRLMFDPECTILNWDKRYKIILGVARALLYLHKHAPIRIIHRDVKPSNILLDESYNPKVADFQLATTINETDCIQVNAISGTYGYMAPEYMIDGYLSTKVDVYSFGVLVLATLTGHKTDDYTLLDNKSLDEFVKRNWLEGTLSNIIDPKIDVDSSNLATFFEIGLLCVQKDAKDRPTMEEVVSMLLDSSFLTLPVAKMLQMVTRVCSNSTIVHVVDDYDTNAAEEFLSEMFPR